VYPNYSPDNLATEKIWLVQKRFQTGNERIRCDEKAAKVYVDSLSWKFLDMVHSENF
jgi:hypothetical protein